MERKREFFVIEVVVEGNDPAVNPGFPEAVGVVSEPNQLDPFLYVLVGPYQNICSM